MQDQTRNGSNAKLGTQSFFMICAISALSTLVTIALFLLIVEWWSSISILDRGHCFDSGSKLWCPVDEPLDDSGLVAVLSNFYTNIIVILISILALVTTIATVSIRFSARQQIENELPDLTESFFMSAVGSKKVEEILSGPLREAKTKIESQDGLIDGMLQRFESIEYKLEALDSGANVEAPEDGED